MIGLHTPAFICSPRLQALFEGVDCAQASPPSAKSNKAADISPKNAFIRASSSGFRKEAKRAYVRAEADVLTMRRCWGASLQEGQSSTRRLKDMDASHPALSEDVLFRSHRSGRRLIEMDNL